MEALFLLLALIFLLVLPALTVVAFLRSGRQQKHIRLLAREILLLQEQQKGEAGPPQETAAAGDEAAAEPAAASAMAFEPASDSEPVAREPITPAAAIPDPQPARKAARTGDRLEEKLASRWLVWLGGVAIAAAGIFLGKYVIEQGMLGPLARMILGMLAGVALVAGGEWLRRRPLQRAIATLRPDYVPPALAAGGIVTAFASAYTGYALADLMAPTLAFVILAVIAIGALFLALLHGPFLAALGLAGAYAVPMLISTGAPLAWGVFPYLFFVTFSGFAIVRHLDWAWLRWLCLGGALG